MQQHNATKPPRARTRISAPDPFNGARGHDYIRQRGLAPRIAFKGQTASGECQCAPCVRERLLPAVMAICSAGERRQASRLQDVPWNDLADESVHELLEV